MLAQLVPLLAGALWGGTLADAVDRRKVLLLTQVAMAMAVAGLVINASLSHPAVWPLFACSAASAGFQGVDWPARRAALPMLVGRQDVTAAIALQTSMQQLALVAGPALAGILIATIGLSAVYGIDVASFAVAFVAAVLLPALTPSGGGTPMGLRSMTEGFRHLRQERLLSATYWIDLNAMIFGMPRAVFPALGLHLYDGGAAVVGLLYAAPGAGALIGSLFTGWCSHVRHQGRAIAACVMAWGLTITLFGLIPVLWIGLALLGLAGAADVISAVLRQAVQQRTVPDHLQGRLSGTFFAVVAGGPRLGDAETGVAAAIGGPQFAVWSGGLACMVGVFVLLWRVPELWQDDGGGHSLSAEEEHDAIAEVITELGAGRASHEHAEQGTTSGRGSTARQSRAAAPVAPAVLATPPNSDRWHPPSADPGRRMSRPNGSTSTLAGAPERHLGVLPWLRPCVRLIWVWASSLPGPWTP